MMVDANALFGMWGMRTPGIGNGDTIDACAAHPDRLRGLCVANPKSDLTDPLEQMARCRDAGFVGLRLSPQHGYSYADTELLAPVIERAAEYDWPVWASLCVVQSTPHGAQSPGALGPLLDAWPEVPFIVTGVTYVNRIDALRVLRPRKNARIDLATLQSVFCVEALCEDLGADRVVLGTGFAIHCYSVTLEKVRRAEISDEERAAVVAGNVAALIDLG